MHLLIYIPWLIKEIFASGLQVAWAALRPNAGYDPVVVRYPLRVTTEWQIFWLTTSITATPSTLSLGLREPATPGQPRILLVQAAFGSDPADVVAGLADMESRMAPHVRGIDHNVPGQGSATELHPRYYEYPLGRKEQQQ
ncbi:monovalent cation/H+ antiporter subunit E [Corynebacterium sp. YIM 101645]|uniref:Monovalent cation/H+ antiporter subunit E n=1 Tax=Corynebacterium lemuris TaxID=1859292 RepID=A0ABT2FT36_9CORY|nr:monovalent cation/H+ antiporter subunit E [Corynebacterium lemuris]MCS5478286.1 monovalent cation/H+ antiporter subunit E [Corynebacterium lemuris]